MHRSDGLPVDVVAASTIIGAVGGVLSLSWYVISISSVQRYFEYTFGLCVAALVVGGVGAAIVLVYQRLRGATPEVGGRLAVPGVLALIAWFASSLLSAFLSPMWIAPIIWIVVQVAVGVLAFEHTWARISSWAIAALALLAVAGYGVAGATLPR